MYACMRVCAYGDTNDCPSIYVYTHWVDASSAETTGEEGHVQLSKVYHTRKNIHVKIHTYS